MAKIWKEEFDPTRHHNRMDAGPAARPAKDNLLPSWVYFVRVCSFTFEFHSVAQINHCLEYYDRKLQSSSRMNIGGADHWETQRWFERLPMYLREEPKRKDVVKALAAALEQFDSNALTT